MRTVDPPSGRFRARYAASDPVAAAREWFPGRRLAEAHGDLVLVRLDDPLTALHLTHQRTLDALDLDDRINTGRLDAPGGADPLLAMSQELAGRTWDWWNGFPPPLVYRTRTMPAARSIAFHQRTTWVAVEARHLREAQALLVTLVLHHGFDVPEAWLI